MQMLKHTNKGTTLGRRESVVCLPCHASAHLQLGRFTRLSRRADKDHPEVRAKVVGCNRDRSALAGQCCT
uniref:Uncharacterized protein n=1 Tax=uncultured marine virus TaxID=186617 RepID=A0A0F7L096_9VIRU|nr:hypothetical protein [uncultured marine virus]